MHITQNGCSSRRGFRPEPGLVSVRRCRWTTRSSTATTSGTRSPSSRPGCEEEPLMIERGRGLAPDRRRRAPLPRRRLLALVQRPRPSPRRDRRRRRATSSARSPTRRCSASPTPAPPSSPPGWSRSRRPGSRRVFYSDSGSTATEIALKMAFQYQQQRGGQHTRRTSFVHLRDAYHGDTIGSVSVGGIDLFHAPTGRCSSTATPPSPATPPTSSGSSPRTRRRSPR